MTFAPKSGFPFDPLRTPDDKPSSNLYTGVFGNSKNVTGPDSRPSSIKKNLDTLVSEIQELGSANESNFDITVNFIAQRLLDFFEGSGVAIAIEQGSRILCCASAGETAPDVGTALNLASGISGVCFRTGQSQYCYDARRDERVDFETCNELGVLSILISPVLVDGRTVGLVEVFSPEEFFFDRVDIFSLERIADLVAQAHVRKPAAKMDTNAPHTMAAAATAAPVMTPSFAAAAPNAAAASAAATSPAISYSPTLPNSVVSTSASGSAAPAKSFATVASMDITVPASVLKPVSGRKNKILLSGCILALLVAAGFGIRALLREKPAPQNSPTTSPAASAIPQPAIAAPLGATAPAIAAAASVTSSSTNKTADKKTASSNAAAPQSNSASSRSPQVMDLRDQEAIPLRRPNIADVTAETPSLNSSSLNKSAVDLASIMPTGTASLPKLNHTPVIERETLIYKVTPVYPAIAKSAHVNGEVVVKIMIGKDGSVRNLVIEKGPAMLRGAVLEAVRQWKYKPYKVDGDPREIESIVSVNFR